MFDDIDIDKIIDEVQEKHPYLLWNFILDEQKKFLFNNIKNLLTKERNKKPFWYDLVKLMRSEDAMLRMTGYDILLIIEKDKLLKTATTFPARDRKAYNALMKQLEKFVPFDDIKLEAKEKIISNIKYSTILKERLTAMLKDKPKNLVEYLDYSGKILLDKLKLTNKHEVLIPNLYTDLYTEYYPAFIMSVLLPLCEDNIENYSDAIKDAIKKNPTAMALLDVQFEKTTKGFLQPARKLGFNIDDDELISEEKVEKLQSQIKKLIFEMKYNAKNKEK